MTGTLVLGATGDTAGNTSGDTGGVAIESLGAGADPRAARTIVEDIQRGIDPDDVAVFQLSMPSSTRSLCFCSRRAATAWRRASRRSRSS